MEKRVAISLGVAWVRGGKELRPTPTHSVFLALEAVQQRSQKLLTVLLLVAAKTRH
jgi:hypothetical protein